MIAWSKSAGAAPARWFSIGIRFTTRSPAVKAGKLSESTITSISIPQKMDSTARRLLSVLISTRHACTVHARPRCGASYVRSAVRGARTRLAEDLSEDQRTVRRGLEAIEGRALGSTMVGSRITGIGRGLCQASMIVYVMAAGYGIWLSDA